VAAIIDNNMRFILDGEKTPAELIALLKEDAVFRVKVCIRTWKFFKTNQRQQCGKQYRLW
jgi:hypothetical protein